MDDTVASATPWWIIPGLVVNALGVVGIWLWSYWQLRQARTARRDICLQELYRRRFDVYAKLARLACEVGAPAQLHAAGGYSREDVAKISELAGGRSRREVLRALGEESGAATLILEESVSVKLAQLLHAIGFSVGLEDGLSGDPSLPAAFGVTTEPEIAADKEILMRAVELIQELQATLHIEELGVDLEKLITRTAEAARSLVDTEAKHEE